MKQVSIFLVSLVLIAIAAGCSSGNKLVYKKVIEHQVAEGGNEIYDKVEVYKINSKKDSLCYYKKGKFVGATVIVTEKK
ncbi:MAG: hypothetical protein ACQESK_07040 [Bacteroidota bacterium]